MTDRRGLVALVLVVIAAAILAGVTLSAPMASESVDATTPPAATPSDDTASACATSLTEGAQGQRSLFRPEDLVLLEGPDREIWQQPDLIMDALQIAENSEVADIGAGAGWFTIRLARRVGPNGTVYAQDLQHQMVTAIRRRVEREGLRNVRVILGDENSPNLPARALDAVLVVDVYPEIPVEARVTFLRNVAEALRPKGRIGIVNYRVGGGGPGPDPGRRVAAECVERDAGEAGLRVLTRRNLRYQYLIVLAM